MIDEIEQQIFQSEHLAIIFVAEECHRKVDPDHGWHVFEWMCWKQRCKLRMIARRDMAINMSLVTT